MPSDKHDRRILGGWDFAKTTKKQDILLLGLLSGFLITIGEMHSPIELRIGEPLCRECMKAYPCDTAEIYAAAQKESHILGGTVPPNE